MKIAFYAPLKPPDHVVPSGDRQMARQLMAALHLAGHDVELVSRLRSYATAPELDALAALRSLAAVEIERLRMQWTASPAALPDLWFTYHPYYKAPDLVGPPLAALLDIPYVTAEASHAGKRDADMWRDWQRPVTDALRQAAVHFWFTEADRSGLARLLGSGANLVDLPPFIDVQALAAPHRQSERYADRPFRLITAAMMRPGKKLRSYGFLAQALGCLQDLDWQLTIIGDGEARAEVAAAFSAIEPTRLRWSGERPREEVFALLSDAALFVWPGFDEDYGMVYLEAQAAGLPVVALASDGVARAMHDGETGGLVREASPQVFAQAIGGLMADPCRCERMSAAARIFASEERSMERAAIILGAALRAAVARHRRESADAIG